MWERRSSVGQFPAARFSKYLPRTSPANSAARQRQMMPQRVQTIRGRNACTSTPSPQRSAGSTAS